MSAKINKHIFHGIYSNGYSPPSLYLAYLYNKNTLHYNRAIEGYINQAGEKVYFENENSVLKFYKYIEEEELENVCKNYFTFEEKDFHKYKNLFHRMTKGFKLETQTVLKYKGKDVGGNSLFDPDQLWEFDETLAGANRTLTKTFQNPGIEGYYVVNVGFSNGGIKINGEDPLPIEKQEPSKSVTLTAFGINIDNSDSEFDSGPGVGLNLDNIDTYIVGNINVTWISAYTPLDSELSLDVKIDSTKVFNIQEFEKRLPGDLITVYGVDFLPNESSEINERYENIIESGQFNSNNFKARFLFTPKYFPDNATHINDPVLTTTRRFRGIFNDNPNLDLLPLENGLYIKTRYSSQRDGGSGGLVFDKPTSYTGSTSRFSDTLGDIKIDIKNLSKKHSVQDEILNTINRFENVSDCYIGGFFYIKSIKKYICFLEFENYSTNFYLGVSTNKFSELRSVLEKNDCLQLDWPDIEKKKLPIKVFDNTVEIEVFSSANKRSVRGLNNDNCSNIFYKYVNYTVDIQTTASIKIDDWKKEDFDKNNKFPPKIN